MFLGKLLSKKLSHFWKTQVISSKTQIIFQKQEVKTPYYEVKKEKQVKKCTGRFDPEMYIMFRVRSFVDSLRFILAEPQTNVIIGIPICLFFILE